MWNIRGKVYDLTLFINKHPGGKNILTACKGSDDLTASFESNHVMCDMKKIEKIMEKYQIGVCTPSSISLKNDGFYRTIQNRVKDKLKNNYKGNFKWAIKSIIQGTLFLMSFIYAFYGNYNIVYRMFFAAFAGHMILQFGFCVMHDGSHSAISKNKYINNFCTDIWNALAFWDSQLWMKHHVFRHHAFTGDNNKDPDVIHFKPYIRKSEKEPENRYWRVAKLYPKTVALFATSVFPGMFIGQGILYNLIWIPKGFVYRMKLSELYKISLFETFIKLFVIFSFLYGNSILVFMTYAIVANVTYSVCIMPDHDTYETMLNHLNDTENVDWGEIQVRHSGNFATDNPWIGNLFGGINYQIEHHLFPTVSHIHFPTIQPIVEKTCKEFNIPYVHHDSVLDAVVSTLKAYAHVAKSK